MRAGLPATLSAALALLAGCVSSSPSQQAPASKADVASSLNVQLGIAYLQQGNLAVAQEKLDRALRENPRDPNVHAALAMLEERLGNRGKADDQYRQALRIAPHNPDIMNNYAVYLCRAGRTDDGVKRFEQAAHDPFYRAPESAYTNAGVCLMGARRYAEAEKSFTRALELKPAYPEAAMQMGELYLATGRLPEAKQRVERYIDNFRENPEILWLGVRVARASGDRLAAERYARKLRVDFPESEQARLLADPGHGG